MISVKNAGRSFGDIKACLNISFDVQPGEITALLGPNGAGKTTLLKMISGILFPSEGNVYVNGFDTTEDPVLARQQCGALFENVPLYGNLTVAEQLSFMAGIYGIPRREIAAKVKRVIDVCMIEEVSNSLILNKSRGFRQRTGLAQAIVHDPAVLVLDEPTNGLDPVQLAEFRTLIRYISPNRTILFSTHIMQEVESLCSKIVMMDNGSIIEQGTLGEICERAKTETIEDAFVRLASNHDRNKKR